MPASLREVAQLEDDGETPLPAVRVWVRPPAPRDTRLTATTIRERKVSPAPEWCLHGCKQSH